MGERDLESRLAPLVQTQAEILGLTIWGLEAPSGSGRQMVRVYVETGPKGEDGVNVDTLAKFSRALSVALDVEDAVPGAYTLEVSSPGLERRFFSLDQLAGYEGQTVTARLADPDPETGRRKITGKLAGVENDRVGIVEEDDQRWNISWDRIKCLNLVHEF